MKTIGDQIEEEEYSEEYTNGVNRTYSIMCSRKQVMPRLVEMLALRTDSILDFGAGKDAFGTIYLREHGFERVTAHEIGSNFVSGVHDPDAMSTLYKVVFANNVLNVQPSVLEVVSLLHKIQGLVMATGIFICNYPVNPRKSDMSVELLEELLNLGFPGDVERVGYKAHRAQVLARYRAPMWVCRMR